MRIRARLHRADRPRPLVAEMEQLLVKSRSVRAGYGQVLGELHGPLEQRVQTAWEESAGPEVGLAHRVSVCLGARDGDIFRIACWRVLAGL
jgi:hypothetical protein